MAIQDAMFTQKNLSLVIISRSLHHSTQTHTPPLPLIFPFLNRQSDGIECSALAQKTVTSNLYSAIQNTQPVAVSLPGNLARLYSVNNLSSEIMIFVLQN